MPAHLGQTKLVEGTLAAGAVAVAVASNGLLDLVVLDVGVDQGLGDGLLGHVRVAGKYR